MSIPHTFPLGKTRGATYWVNEDRSNALPELGRVRPRPLRLSYRFTTERAGLSAPSSKGGLEVALRKRVACSCGWAGTVADLVPFREPRSKLDTQSAPVFSGCPTCKSDRGLE